MLLKQSFHLFFFFSFIWLIDFEAFYFLKVISEVRNKDPSCHVSKAQGLSKIHIAHQAKFPKSLTKASRLYSPNLKQAHIKMGESNYMFKGASGSFLVIFPYPCVRVLPFHFKIYYVLLAKNRTKK